jgi:hypothetical protein
MELFEAVKRKRAKPRLVVRPEYVGVSCSTEVAWWIGLQSMDDPEEEDDFVIEMIRDFLLFPIQDDLQPCVKWVANQSLSSPKREVECLVGYPAYWETNTVTNMDYLFRNVDSKQFKTWFSGAIQYWDTSNVTSMKGMFFSIPYPIAHFNEPIGNWDVSRVTDMTCMFAYCNEFNQTLETWNTSLAGHTHDVLMRYL